jgi:Cap4-like dsDNA endonuclease family protein
MGRSALGFLNRGHRFERCRDHDFTRLAQNNPRPPRPKIDRGKRWGNGLTGNTVAAKDAPAPRNSPNLYHTSRGLDLSPRILAIHGRQLVNSDLLDGLVSKPQRETAGADSASRFDYQKNWGFCEMLRRHMSGADYLVAFEFHDDVVFLGSSSAPTSAEFFQVKTIRSATPRKLASLTAQRSKNTNSILGKMFANFAGICSAHQVKVILVSNIAFEFADADFCAKDLDPKYRGTIIEKLKAELPSFSESQIDNLHFVITGVSIDAMQSFLHGEAMELFKMRFGEEHGLNVHGWVRLLQSEIGRKNNYASDKVASVPDLISKKCIGRVAVEDSLSLISTQRRATPQM